MKYLGSKSSDAEIIIDFVKGDVNFDYSLNKFGTEWESNVFCTIQDDRNKKLRFLDGFLALPKILLLFISYGFFLSPIAHRLGVPQYESQNFAKKIGWFAIGKQEQHEIGEKKVKEISFYIKNNILIKIPVQRQLEY